MKDSAPTLFRLQVNFVDDKTGKPIGINKHIGRRPIAAFGNSDGDLEMLQWTTLGASGPRLGLIVHHTDAEREYPTTAIRLSASSMWRWTRQR